MFVAGPHPLSSLLHLSQWTFTFDAFAAQDYIPKGLGMWMHSQEFGKNKFGLPDN